jgi:hypothetical protein
MIDFTWTVLVEIMPSSISNLGLHIIGQYLVFEVYFSVQAAADGTENFHLLMWSYNEAPLII